MPSNWTALEVKKCICFIKFVFFQGQRNVCLFDLFDFVACQTFMYEDQQPKSSLSFVRSMKLWKALKFTSKATFNAHSSCPHMATCPCAISEPKKTPEAISIINKNCVATTTQQIKYDSFNEFYKLQSVSIEKFTQLTHTFRWTNRISTSRCKGFFYSIQLYTEIVYFHFYWKKCACTECARLGSQKCWTKNEFLTVEKSAIISFLIYYTIGSKGFNFSFSWNDVNHLA